MVEISPFREEWSQQFRAVASVLSEALKSVAGARIEHVGSTAVPGLDAKPILDIDVLAPAASMHAAIAAVQDLGYTHVGERGIPHRHAFDAPDTSPARNVYVCRIDSIAARNHLALRDTLRNSEDARRRYTAVKRELASDASLTLEQYAARKSFVVREILSESGLLSEDELDEVFRSNSPAAGGSDIRRPRE